MAAYKDLVGQKITKVTSNPGEPKTGQMWYNSTSGTLRGLGILQAWASSGSLNSARGFVSHTGTQTASLLAGGLSPAPAYFSASEEYNGSGWSTGGSLPAATYALSSAGTQTAALVFGGANSSDTKQSTTLTYNGTSFSATPNSLNTARDQLSGGGTQTSALAVGGRVSSAVVTNMEEWNGSSWTNLTALPEKRGYTHANGPETAFFMASGALGDNAGAPYTNATLNYDGSSISTGENVNTARSAGGAAGDSANAIFYGGDISGTSQTKTEKYDGTSWSEVADMAVAKRGSGAGAGTSNAAALSAGAYGPPASASTEEFTSSTNTITAAAWSSSGNLPAVIAANQGGGTQTAGISISGQVTAPGNASTTATNEYDGSAWTAGGSLAAGASSYSGYSSQKGTQTSMLFWGGYGNPGGARNTVSSYNGSSWTAQSVFPSTILYGGGAGTQTAALAVGQSGGSGATKTFESDGSYNWTSGGDLSTGRLANATCGPQTAAITAGGLAPAPAATNATEEYNGSSWTAGGNLLTAAQNKQQCFGADSSDMLIATKRSGTPGAEGYDGTVWSTRPSMGTPRNDGGGCGSVGNSGLVMGGNVPGFTAATEEFTGKTTAINIADFTTS